jgi:hypothetical protein
MTLRYNTEFKQKVRLAGFNPTELTPDDVPGYWSTRCEGGDKCRHAFRIVLGPCDGSAPLSVFFAEHGTRDERGRWVRPFREWERQRKERKP